MSYGGLIPSIPSKIASNTGLYDLDITSDDKFIYTANIISNDITTYSLNLANGLLSLLNLSTPSGLGTSKIKITKNLKFLYTFNFSENTISQFIRDIVTGNLTPLIPFKITLAAVSIRIIISPDSKFIYCLSPVSFNNKIFLYGIDNITGKLTIISTFPLLSGGANEFLISNNGKNLYVLDQSNSTIYQFSINKIDGSITPLSNPYIITTDLYPYNFTISKDDKFLYVINNNYSIIKTYPINQIDGSIDLTIQSISTALSPQYILVSPDNKSLYCSTNSAGGNISQYSIANGILTKLLPNNVGTDGVITFAMVESSNNKYVYAANYDSNLISMYGATPYPIVPIFLGNKTLKSNRLNNFSRPVSVLGKYKS